jgi:hypothetical protein
MLSFRVFNSRIYQSPGVSDRSWFKHSLILLFTETEMYCLVRNSVLMKYGFFIWFIAVALGSGLAVVERRKAQDKSGNKKRQRSFKRSLRSGIGKSYFNPAILLAD